MIKHNWSVQETEHYSPVLLPVILKLKCDSGSEPVNQYRELSKEASSQNIIVFPRLPEALDYR